MKWLPWLLISGGLLAVTAGCSRSEMEGKVDITFEVKTPGLDEASIVYISGSLPELGEWEADLVPLIRQPDGITWKRRIAFPYGTRMEYKFTLGDWKKEALDEQGAVPPNYTLAATRSHTVTHAIPRWRTPPPPAPEGITGEVVFHRDVEGEGLAPRDIIVWLPPGYHDGEERYPVLYLHDGQNMFDPATSYIGVEWGADETADRLIREGAMKPVIMVGIYNSPQRMDEYSFGELGQAYQKFVTGTVKPMIDAAYRTRPGPEDTASMGSSMGGLISFLLAWNYPGVFQQAACLSPAFFPEVVDMVRSAAAVPEGLRIYMDNGTEGLEQRLQGFCDDMLSVLPAKGLVEGKTLIWYLDQGAEHNEKAWAARVHRPLLFLFGQPSP